MERPAPVDHPVHDLIRRRFSPRAFADRPVTDGELRALFEAARWAPSSYNEQPWSFVAARRGEEPGFSRMLDCLVEWNRAWARQAPLLVLTVARTRFERNGKPNAHAWHDVGLAVAQLTLQATALGLAVHQMAGFSAEAAKRSFGLPDGHEPVTVLAVGAPGDPACLPDDLRRLETAPRTRRPQSQFVFACRWGEPLGG